MTGTFAEDRIHAGNESIQNIKGDKSLYGAGKAAAVNTVSTAAIQVMFSKTQSYSHILMSLITSRNDILQIHPGRIAART